MFNSIWAGLWDRIFFIFILLLPLAGKAQTNVEKELLVRLEKAGSDSMVIRALNDLADYYYANKDFERADSLIEKQIMVAEASLRPGLILQAYFGNAAYRATTTTTRDRSENTRRFISRALDYAKLNNFNDHAAMAYANLSALCANTGKTEEAFQYASLGSTMAMNTDSDTAKVTCTVQLGNTYLQRSDLLMAFRTYTNAVNLAMANEQRSLLPGVYHAIASLYKKLGNSETARVYLFRSLDIHKKIHDQEGEVADLIALAKNSNYVAGKDYLQEAIKTASAIPDYSLLIEAEKILFSHMLLHEKPAFMINYMVQRPELRKLFENTGDHYLDWMLAEIYLYGNAPDTALAYFKKAEEAFNKGYDLTTQKNFFGEYAWCLSVLNRVDEAISYYEKSFRLAGMAADLSRQMNHAGSLRDLFHKKGNFQQAFEYSMLYEHYKDSVDLLGKERDLALMEIRNEEKEQVRLSEAAERSLQREHNLKYMIITLLIAGVFLVILMVGMFKVSTFTIRLMGFLSLIFFFEFIILILDNKIHHLTHGDPLQVWLIKIGIISILLPLHHFTEHKLIHYLMSRHLIRLRKKLVLSALSNRKKTKPIKPVLPDAPGGGQ